MAKNSLKTLGFKVVQGHRC